MSTKQNCIILGRINFKCRYHAQKATQFLLLQALCYSQLKNVHLSQPKSLSSLLPLLSYFSSYSPFSHLLPYPQIGGTINIPPACLTEPTSSPAAPRSEEAWSAGAGPSRRWGGGGRVAGFRSWSGGEARLQSRLSPLIARRSAGSGSGRRLN